MIPHSYSDFSTRNLPESKCEYALTLYSLLSFFDGFRNIFYFSCLSIARLVSLCHTQGLMTFVYYIQLALFHTTRTFSYNPDMHVLFSVSVGILFVSWEKSWKEKRLVEPFWFAWVLPCPPSLYCWPNSQLNPSPSLVPLGTRWHAKAYS